MKKLAAIVLLVALTLSLVSCGDTEPSTESAEPPATASPSATPSAEPSIEPSAEPSEPPADDIDAYWDGRVLTSDSGDLMMDAARWVRDYYRSFDYAHVAYEKSIEPTFTAARLTDLSDGGLELFTELCYYGPNKEIFADDSYGNSYRRWRSVVFRFESTEGGYEYAGMSEIGENASQIITASYNGEPLDMTFEHDVLFLESAIGTVANGEREYADIPEYSKHLGTLSYNYGDVSTTWEFYKSDTTDQLLARCKESGELFGCGWNCGLFAELPTPEELADDIREIVGESLFVNTKWGNFYLSDDARTEILEHADFVKSSSQMRICKDSHDSINEDVQFRFGTTDRDIRFTTYKDSDKLSVYYDGIGFVVEGATEMSDALDRAIDTMILTIRDGQFLTNYERWDVPEVEVEEYELLRRADELLDPFDGSNYLFEGDDRGAASTDYNGTTYYDHTVFYDPDSDGWLAHVSSYADFEAYVREVFCKELADKCMREGWHYANEFAPPFIKGPKGELYGHPSGRGGNNPWVGYPLAMYSFEPKKDVLVIRNIYEHYESVSGDYYDYENMEVVGDTAWDTVFVREQGQWKLLDTARIVP